MENEPVYERLRNACLDIETGEPLDDDARPDLYVSDLRAILEALSAPAEGGETTAEERLNHDIDATALADRGEQRIDVTIDFLSRLIRDADKAATLTAPVEGVALETTAKERKIALNSLGYMGRNTVLARALRDIATLTAALAAEKERRSGWHEQADEWERRWVASEAARVKAEAELREVADDVCSFLCPSTWRTADGPPPHHPKCRAIRAALGETP